MSWLTGRISGRVLGRERVAIDTLDRLHLYCKTNKYALRMRETDFMIAGGGVEASSHVEIQYHGS